MPPHPAVPNQNASLFARLFLGALGILLLLVSAIVLVFVSWSCALIPFVPGLVFCWCAIRGRRNTVTAAFDFILHGIADFFS
jgi:hypothetical protein